MLRNDFNISDDEFYKITKPFEEALTKYILNTFIYEYLAFYISKGVELNALWEGNLKGHIYAAFDSIYEIEYKNKLDYNILKNTLKEKYNINLTNNKPIKIEKSN